MCKTSTSTVNGFFPKLKTQEFTWSWWRQGASTMSPSTLSIKETSFKARIYTNWNTLQYSNNFAWLRITGKSYQYYFSNEFELNWETSWNTTAWTTVNKSSEDTTVYMQIWSLQWSLTASWPVYLEYRERTTQAINKVVEWTHKLRPKQIDWLWVNAFMISFLNTARFELVDLRIKRKAPKWSFLLTFCSNSW